MRSLKSGIISLALVGAAAAVPQAAFAVASFSVDSVMLMGVRYDYTGYTGINNDLAPLAGTKIDGTYTGGGQVTSRVKTSTTGMFNSGTVQTSTGNYNAFTKTYADVGATSLDFDINTLMVKPAYSGVPAAYTTLGYVSMTVSGSADGSGGDSALWGGA